MSPTFPHLPSPLSHTSKLPHFTRFTPDGVDHDDALHLIELPQVLR